MFNACGLKLTADGKIACTEPAIKPDCLTILTP
jgi:hypothetical protein